MKSLEAAARHNPGLKEYFHCQYCTVNSVAVLQVLLGSDPSCCRGALAPLPGTSIQTPVTEWLHAIHSATHTKLQILYFSTNAPKYQQLAPADCKVLGSPQSPTHRSSAARSAHPSCRSWLEWKLMNQGFTLASPCKPASPVSRNSRYLCAVRGSTEVASQIADGITAEWFRSAVKGNKCSDYAS